MTKKPIILSELEQAQILLAEELKALEQIKKGVTEKSEPESAITQQEEQVRQAEKYLAELRQQQGNGGKRI
jgi:hypothetical protein